MRTLLGAGRSARLLLVALSVGLTALGIIGLTTTMASAAANGHAGDASLHPFTVTSPNFRDGGRLPLSAEAAAPAFGCSGQNVAPTLRWTNAPAGTQSFAFTMNDVDAPVAGGFHHWVVYNIPASVHELSGTNQYTQGLNSLGQTGYLGPCPPPTGQVHHYVFSVYGLSVAIVPGAHVTFEELLKAIAPDVLGVSSIIGTFRRPLDD